MAQDQAVARGSHSLVAETLPVIGMSAFAPVPARPSSSEVLCCGLFRGSRAGLAVGFAGCSGGSGWGAGPGGRRSYGQGLASVLIPKAVPVVAPAVLT